MTEIGAPALLEDDRGRPVVALAYNASNRDLSIVVYEMDCVTRSSVPLAEFDEERSDTTGFLDVSVRLTLDPDTVVASPIWRPSLNAGGMATFCVSAALYAENRADGDDSVGPMVVRQDTIFFADVDDANGDFTVADVTTAPSATSVAFDDDYAGKVRAYECDPLTTDELESGAASYAPDDVIAVCVMEESDDDLVVSNVFSLVLRQENGYVVFDAVVDNVVPPLHEDLVTVECDDGMCVVRVRLVSQLFKVDETNVVLVRGDVMVDARTTGRRAYNDAFVLSVDLGAFCRDGSNGNNGVRAMIDALLGTLNAS